MPPKILVAADNERLAVRLGELLRGRGMATEWAVDGAAARRMAEARPDALILDLPGPAAIDLLQQLRQAPAARDLPVILLAGADPGARQWQSQAAALGVSRILPRPFRAEDLLRALASSLAPPRTAEMHPLARHLQRAFAARFCGCYRFGPEDEAPGLWFLNGSPVALRPGFVHRDFADWLQRRGLLSTDEARFFRSEGEVPELLVQMGCLPFPQLWREQLDYLQAELLAAFGRPPMAVREQLLPSPPVLPLPAVNVPALILEGFHHHADPEGARQVLAACGRRFVGPGRNFFRLFNFLQLEGEARQLMQRLDGTRTLQDCLAGQPELLPLVRTLQLLEMIRFAEEPPAAFTGPDFPLRTLFNAVEEESQELGLEHFTDLVKEAGRGPGLAPPPPAPPAAGEAPSSPAAKVKEARAALDGKNHYEIFDLTAGSFSFDRLRESYFRWTREFGPDTLMQLAGAEAAMAEEILAAVSVAYNTLSDVVKKERYDELLGSEKIGLGRPGDERFQAQVQFQSGKVFIGMEEWDSAEKALQDACTSEPGNGLYLAHLAWAIYRNPASARSRALQEKARQMLNRALGLERSAEGFAFRGRMLLDGGQDILAEAEFAKALKLNPRLPLVRAGMREIEERREQEKKGLFRKIFR